MSEGLSADISFGSSKIGFGDQSKTDWRDHQLKLGFTGSGLGSVLVSIAVMISRISGGMQM
jgi:hypothetical protein